MTFDLKAAREICPRVKGYEDPDGGNFADFQAAEMLPAALDEIERLEAAYLKAQNSNLLRKQAYESLEKIASEQANRITEQSYGIKKLKENLSDYWQARDEQAKRIAELENSLGISAIETRDFQIIVRKQHAALKKLGQAKRERGKALVEERARFNVAMKVVPLNTNFPNSDHKKAREQLRREGLL